MPLSDEVRSLLLKYIAGETDEEETQKVQQLLAADAAVFDEFEQLWDLWYAVGAATNVNRFNVDKGWEAILNKRKTEEQRPRVRRPLRKSLILGSAAAAAILLLVFLLHPYAGKSGSSDGGYPDIEEASGDSLLPERQDLYAEESGFIDFYTSAGKRKRVVLPDGSVTWLNGNTAIRYEDHRNVRMLYLKGEAFFNIRHDAGKPFIVNTSYATIQVLGTRFNVSAYPDDTVTDAVLTSGSILFTTEMHDESVVRHLLPGEKISINHLSDKLKIARVDTIFYTAWKEGRLLFEGQTFGEIARAMEHKYSVNIEFADKGLESKRLNGYLQQETLSQALEALRLTLQFRYKIIDSSVILYR
jgi:ferric-dicitrate binding protein FerR (iron transport regulator)